MTMELLSEAEKISDKKELTVADYKRFIEIGRKITNPELSFFYDNFSEAFSLRLPEIAAKEGNYNFLEEEDK